ncbi:RND transporter [Burkholderia sp. SRS-W-2-2016]|uniref:TolC family protein n=1 Tax=Burkholderia sp. SRS-W-2-2016 TaxID=1926878 RepID=UPI00094B17E7|nr:TolC family protein [Burkholderia sp. SRS-W-2-2016]OLL32110.1 RND transporter [Burkholderia sp. SRS-W-2-2016]
MLPRWLTLLLLATTASSAAAQLAVPSADSAAPLATTSLTATHGDSPDASTPSALSLEDVLGLAAQANPSLRGARADADASAGVLLQAGARPNPGLSFLQEGFGGMERTSTALVNQTIELGGKRGARLDVAAYGREAALAALDGRGAALRAQVIAAFYGLLAAQRQLEVAEDSARIAARSADMAEKRARAGKVSPVEATKARVASAGAQIERDNASTRVLTALERLQNVAGSDALRGHPVVGDLENVPSAEPLSALVSRLDDSPNARAAKAQMLRANAAISVERAKRIPDITVSAGMKRVVTGGVPDNQAVVGISIPLPLFDSNKGAILEAAHKAESASAAMDAERASLRMELTQTYATFETSALEAKRLRTDVLPAARDALNAMSRGYELGKFSFLDVLDAQRTLFEQQSRYVQSLASVHVAYAELYRLVGMPMPAGTSPAIQ